MPVILRIDDSQSVFLNSEISADVVVSLLDEYPLKPLQPVYTTHLFWFCTYLN